MFFKDFRPQKLYKEALQNTFFRGRGGNFPGGNFPGGNFRGALFPGAFFRGTFFLAPLAPVLIWEYRGQRKPVFIAYFMEYILFISYKTPDVKT